MDLPARIRRGAKLSPPASPAQGSRSPPCTAPPAARRMHLTYPDRQDVLLGLELIQHGRERNQGGPATMRVRLEGERQRPVVQADFDDAAAGASDPIPDFD